VAEAVSLSPDEFEGFCDEAVSLEFGLVAAGFSVNQLKSNHRSINQGARQPLESTIPLAFPRRAQECCVAPR